MVHLKEKAMLGAMKLRAGLMEVKKEESGMEIIQVLILLAVGLGLIATFIGFGDRITAAVTTKVEDFLSTFGA